VEYSVGTLVGQRIVGIALGYEDVSDHDELRHDPVLALFADRLEPKRADCAPLAGKSTLNRLEHAPRRPDDRYHKIDHDPKALARLFVELFLEAHKRPPNQIVLDLDATDEPCTGSRRGILSRLLCLLLLPAAVRLLRPAFARGTAAALEHRCFGRRRRRDRTHRCASSPGLAAGADRAPCRFGLRARGADGLMLSEPRRVCLRACPQPAPDRRARSRPRRRGRRACRDRPAGAALQGVLYATLDSWSCARRLIGKAEHLAKGANPRFSGQPRAYLLEPRLVAQCRRWPKSGRGLRSDASLSPNSALPRRPPRSGACAPCRMGPSSTTDTSHLGNTG
jgi:hypothetical protein